MSSSPGPSPIALLITPHLNWPFAEHFALHLLSEWSANLFVLLSPFSGTTIPPSLKLFLESKRLNVVFGTTGKRELIGQLVDRNKIRTIFLLHSRMSLCAPNVPADDSKKMLQLCALLESARQCLSPPTLIPVFMADLSAEQFLLFGKPSPVVQCRTQESATFSSACALFHAFAKSYHLDVQICLLECRQELSRIIPSAETMDFVLGLASKEGGVKTEINVLQMTGGSPPTGTNKGESVQVGSVILFGCPSAVRQMAQRGNAILPAELLVGAGGSQLLVAQSRPGLDRDEVVLDEVLTKRVSHVAFVWGPDEPTRADWESGGPAQLRENIRQNLFTPWLLRQLCAQLGLPFVLLEDGSPHLTEEGGGPKRGIWLDSGSGSSRYAVVRHFEGLLAGMEEPGSGSRDGNAY